MKNIEIKARCKDLKKLKLSILTNGGQFEGKMHQIDTYFNTHTGRLKLREINENKSVLIYYERKDTLKSKESDYFIYPTLDPKTLKIILTKSNGIKVVVDKVRELYIFKHTRIHIDKVKKLGNFMELETVITTQTKKEAYKEHKKVIEMLRINVKDLITNSYSDLLLK